MKKILLSILAVFMLLFAVVGCGSTATKDQDAAKDTPATSVEMKYISPAEVEQIVKDEDDSYVLIDARKKADFDTSHVKSSVSADMDSAKEGNTEEGIANLEAALKEATGNEKGKDGAKYVLLCYSGASYAQQGTDLLVEMGINSDDIVTMEGGYKAWTNEDLLVK